MWPTAKPTESVCCANASAPTLLETKEKAMKKESTGPSLEDVI